MAVDATTCGVDAVESYIENRKVSFDNIRIGRSVKQGYSHKICSTCTNVDSVAITSIFTIV